MKRVTNRFSMRMDPVTTSASSQNEDRPSGSAGAANASRGIQVMARSVSMRRNMSSARLMTEGRTLNTSETAIAIREASLKKAVVREPLLVPAPYDSDWAMDLLALAHNAVRIEILDLYKILTSLSKRRMDLISRDFNGFYVWFPVFSRFVTRILEVEEAVIFTWIEGSKQISKGPASKDERTKAFKGITDKLSEIESMKDAFEKEVEQRKVDEFFSCFDELSSAAVDFFTGAERIVPVFIKKNCEQSQKSGVEAQFVKAVSKGMNEIMFTLARGIGKEINGYVKRNTPTLARIHMGANRRKWEEHNELVNAFVELRSEYEKTYKTKKRSANVNDV